MANRLRKHYERLIDELSLDTELRYRDYLLRRPRTVVYHNLVLDIEHLDSFFNCAGCRSRKPKAFCCSGHELELTNHDLAALEKVGPEFFAAFPQVAALAARRGGFWRYGDNFERVMAQKANGDCLFLMPGGAGCSLHRFALERGLDPIDIKPYICSLFPVVAIVIEDQVVVTTLNDDSARILDTGGNTCSCLTRRGRREDHVLALSRPILVRMFGARAFRIMQDAVNAKA